MTFPTPSFTHAPLPPLHPSPASSNPRILPSLRTTPPQPRDRLLTLLSPNTRTPTNPTITHLITQLESTTSSTSPTASHPHLPGIWRNLYTTLPPTSSPLQRTIISNPNLAPAVEQLIQTDRANLPSAIVNRVDFRALLGGVLNVRAVVDAVSARRLCLRFESAWLVLYKWPAWLGGRSLGRVLRVPYPVPFRWLGDKAKGWLDVTYLDHGLRIARGNRGSVFVLVKKNVDDVSVNDDAYLETWLD